MAARRPKKRNYRMIAFKVYYDTDQDILDWWEAIEEGERSDALRDVIREVLGKQPRIRKGLPIPELHEVRQDTLWIRDALNEMPAYLERIIQQIVQSGGMRQGQVPISESPVLSDDPALTDAESQRRTRKLRQATW